MSRLLFIACAALAALTTVFGEVSAGDTTRDLAQTTDKAAVIFDDGAHVELSIGLNKPLPWRVFALDQPARLVVEISNLSWELPPEVNSDSVSKVSVGQHRPGWSRLVAVLTEPLIVETAELSAADGLSQLKIRLLRASAEDFRQSVLDESPDAEPVTSFKINKDNQLTVAIDPGHGGIDPGAEVGGLVEAEIILKFARQLKETLIRSGRFNVVLTRENDAFVPLETRMTLARAARADIFLSLHADALEAESGPASGMTVYTLSELATDAAALQLVERHARNDILAGVDLGAAEDDIAFALQDIARREANPRSEALAGSLVQGFELKSLAVNSKPHRRGEFAVLKAPDIPSVLIELGFLSSAKDRERLVSEKWLRDATEAIRLALELWGDADFLRSQELRH